MGGRKENSRVFQLDLHLPELTNTEFDQFAFDALCDEAEDFLNDRGFTIVSRLIADGRSAGLSEAFLAKYKLACQIRDKQVMYGRKGWEMLPPEPEQD